MQPINDKDNNRNNNAIPRVLLTATSSGIGKTMITCGILKALKNRGLNCAAFKCGPDYIDPMFHRKVLGIDSYNLDTFMCKRTFASFSWKEQRYLCSGRCDGIL